MSFNKLFVYASITLMLFVTLLLRIDPNNARYGIYHCQNPIVFTLSHHLQTHCLIIILLHRRKLYADIFCLVISPSMTNSIVYFKMYDEEM